MPERPSILCDGRVGPLDRTRPLPDAAPPSARRMASDRGASGRHAETDRPVAFARPAAIDRRAWLRGSAGFLAAGAAGAVLGRPAVPIRVGVEAALVASGLAAHLGSALLEDTGLRIDWAAGPSGVVLGQVEQGALDAALVFEPQAEQALLTQNLVHDRRPVARTELLLVGPAPQRPGRRAAGRPSGTPAVLARQRGAGLQATLERIAVAGARGEACFVASGEPSATRALERRAWQPLGVQDGAPWWRTAEPGPASVLALARATGGYALVERGLWQALGSGAPELAVWVEGDPALVVDYHVMRAFRAPHPAGQLMVAWLAGPTGQRAVARFGRGYRPA